MNLNLFSKDELFIILESKTVKAEIKAEVFEQLIKVYHRDRNFNLYQEFIENFYSKRYSLGKTKLDLVENIQRAARHIDVLSRYEANSTEIIPQEHAKYLFAFVKEFLVAIEKLVNANELKFNLEILVNQMEFLRKIVEKQGKNADDTLTTFENVIRNIRQNNPLLLPESTDQKTVEIGTLELNTTLSKISKANLVEIFKNIQLYKEEDFYKIATFAYGKDTTFYRDAKTTPLPFIATAMKKPSKKMDGFDLRDSLKSFIRKYIDEKPADFSFYPFSCVDMDGFYQEYVSLLESDELATQLNQKETRYLKFVFLEAARNISPYLEKEFLRICTEFLTEMSEKLKTKGTNSLTEMLATQLHFEDEDQIMVKRASSSSDLAINLVLTEGKIQPTWQGRMIEVKEDYRSYSRNKKLVPKEDTYSSEALVVSLLLEEIIGKLGPYYSLSSDRRDAKIVMNNEHEFAGELKECLQLFLFDYMNAQIDSKEFCNKYHEVRKNSEKNFFNQLLKFRMEQGLLSYNEIDLMLSQSDYKGWLKSESCKTEAVIALLKDGIEMEAIDPTQVSDIAKLYQLNLKDKQAYHEFMYTILSTVYPEYIHTLNQLVGSTNHNGEQSTEHHTHFFCFEFFRNKLKKEGFEIDNYMF